MFSQCHLLPYFTPATFYFFLKSEIRGGKLLVDPGHLQEEGVGGHPPHRYRRACCHHPVADRLLQKNMHIADEHSKILPETIVSLK
jgi:hypothetical protein